MKLCNICKRPMDADVAFANLHNICRTCLESGQDTECLNSPSVELSEWEHANIRQCKDCKTNFIPLWYGTTLCKTCTKRAHAKRRMEAQIKAEKAQVIELGKKLRKEISGITEVRKKYQQCIHIIQRIERVANEKKACHQRLIAKRIKKYFGSKEPFDIPTLCRILVDWSPYQFGDYAYWCLYKYFAEGIPMYELAPFNKAGFERDIGRYCCAAYHPRMRWLFQPVQRRPKEVKEQELTDRIEDILKSQSRIDLTEPKE